MSAATNGRPRRAASQLAMLRSRFGPADNVNTLNINDEQIQQLLNNRPPAVATTTRSRRPRASDSKVNGDPKPAPPPLDDSKSSTTMSSPRSTRSTVLAEPKATRRSSNASSADRSAQNSPSLARMSTRNALVVATTRPLRAIDQQQSSGADGGRRSTSSAERKDAQVLVMPMVSSQRPMMRRSSTNVNALQQRRSANHAAKPQSKMHVVEPLPPPPPRLDSDALFRARNNIVLKTPAIDRAQSTQKSAGESSRKAESESRSGMIPGDTWEAHPMMRNGQHGQTTLTIHRRSEAVRGVQRFARLRNGAVPSEVRSASNTIRPNPPLMPSLMRQAFTVRPYDVRFSATRSTQKPMLRLVHQPPSPVFSTGQTRFTPAPSPHWRSKSKASSDSSQARQVSVRSSVSDDTTDHWSWVGEPTSSKLVSDSVSGKQSRRTFYNAMRHTQHEVIRVRDDVMLQSSADDSPFIAKVAALWQDGDGSMMMTGYWYWRADQLETSKRRDCDERELLAGAQAEDNSIYTIREKCYVLTPSAFARYSARLSAGERERSFGLCTTPQRASITAKKRQRRCDDDSVESDGGERLPTDADDDIVFFCNRFYDSRSKRILTSLPPTLAATATTTSAPDAGSSAAVTRDGVVGTSYKTARTSSSYIRIDPRDSFYI